MLLKKNSKNRLAIMGGSFDPFHLGHRNSLLTIQKKFKIDRIILIPSFQTPLKESHTQAFHRLKMLQELYANSRYISVDDQEITREGVSYSYKTITQIQKQEPDAEIFLIVGLDQFEIFDKWKNFSKILEKTNLIVTSRSGKKFPKKISECPKKLQSFLQKKQRTKFQLKHTKNQIHFCSLKDRDISSSLIREKISKKKSIKSLVPSAIDSYIQKNYLYRDSKDDFEDIKDILSFCKMELENKKAYDIEIFNLSSHQLPFIGGLIASGSNRIQIQALAKYLKKRMKEKFGRQVLNEEGQIESRWIVLDYGDIVIHIFYDHTRAIYKLDDLWLGIKNESK